MTTTQKPTNPSGQHGASELIVPPIDPENEVDGKSIVLWLTAALIFVVASLWLLAVVFGFSVQGARYDKIDLAPTVELQRTRSAEDVWLRNPKLTLAQWTEHRQACFA
jgi:heme/copper-type cytochrome/quinol oxidase subunit 2